MGLKDMFGAGQGPLRDPAQEAQGEKEELSGEEIDSLIDAVATKVVSMRLTSLAVFTLESAKPFTFLGGQAMYFFEPFVQSVFNLSQYNTFALILDDRRNVEKLIRAIEQLENEYQEKEREEKRKRKREKRRRKEESKKYHG
jgi:hypothetical protein